LIRRDSSAAVAASLLLRSEIDPQTHAVLFFRPSISIRQVPQFLQHIFGTADQDRQ
jgi:hypothetical protein